MKGYTNIKADDLYRAIKNKIRWIVDYKITG